jgi:hypothetical protein
VNLNFTSKPSVIYNGLKRKLTSIKNPQANAILERVHGVLTHIMCTAELDMANLVEPSHVTNFLTNAAWAIRSTYHTVLKASPGTAIFGRDMLLDIPFLANWNKIGEYRQCQNDCNTERENKAQIDWDEKVGRKVLSVRMVCKVKLNPKKMHGL